MEFVYKFLEKIKHQYIEPFANELTQYFVNFLFFVGKIGNMIAVAHNIVHVMLQPNIPRMRTY